MRERLWGGLRHAGAWDPGRGRVFHWPGPGHTGPTWAILRPCAHPDSRPTWALRKEGGACQNSGGEILRMRCYMMENDRAPSGIISVISIWRLRAHISKTFRHHWFSWACFRTDPIHICCFLRRHALSEQMLPCVFDLAGHVFNGTLST